MVKTRNEVTREGIERTMATIQTTAAALREKALRELAGHHKPTLKPRKVKAQERAALRIIGAAQVPLYTARAIGEGMGKLSGIDFLDATNALGAVNEKLRRVYQETAAVLPASHPARRHLAEAEAALVNLEESTEAFDATSEATMPKPPKQFLRAAGSVIVHFVSISGQNMERALRELGDAGPWCGWLAEIGQDKS